MNSYVAAHSNASEGRKVFNGDDDGVVVKTDDLGRSNVVAITLDIDDAQAIAAALNAAEAS